MVVCRLLEQASPNLVRSVRPGLGILSAMAISHQFENWPRPTEQILDTLRARYRESVPVGKHVASVVEPSAFNRVCPSSGINLTGGNRIVVLPISLKFF